MSDKILIRYDAVYAKVAELSRRLDNQLLEMESEYNGLQTCLQGMDGRTNATYCETMMQNQMKANVVCETLRNLLKFMELSAKQVEHDELVLKGIYTMGDGGGASSAAPAIAQGGAS